MINSVRPQRVRTSRRRIRQRWKWVPFPVRMRFVRLRNRWVHRRGAKRVAFAALLIVLFVSVAAPSPNDPEVGDSAIDLPPGHRLVSLPLGPTVPPIDVGDEVDLYIAEEIGNAFTIERSVPLLLDEPGLVLRLEQDALVLAVAETLVSELLVAISAETVLVVGR